MQAIARSNRVKEGKNNGLIVDYCGILKNLRKALATFAGHTGEGDPGEGGGETDPLHPEEELLDELREAIGLVTEQLQGNGFDLASLHEATGLTKNAALVNAKEAVNVDDESRKKFEISARAVFRKYKACLTFKGVQDFRRDYEAISFIYKMLEDDRENADTSAIIQKLNAIVSEAIDVKADPGSDEKIFDISKINFDLLRKEFEKSPQKKTDVQNLKDSIEKRLRKMLMENPLRTDFQERFDEIVRDYNKEKDKNTIEATFEALMRLTAEMQEEELEYVAEGFDTQEQKTIYDMLRKPELSKGDIRKIKAVSVDLLKLIQSRMEDVQGIFAKQSTSDGFRQSIYDFLYDEKTGLPADSYTPEDVDLMTESVFSFVQVRHDQAVFA